MRAICLSLMLTVLASLGQAQQAWSNLDQLLFPHLTRTGTAEGAFWLPDQMDPTTAQRAVGVVYEYIEGSAGNTTIAVGLYRNVGTGWVFDGLVAGLFGHTPREASFGPTFVELTTDTLGTHDARCCPSQQTRWRIDFATRTATALN